MTPESTISARDLVVPAIAPQLDATTEFFRALRQLDKTIRLARGTQKDRAIALILACLYENIDTGKRIVGVLRQLGFNAQFVGMILQQNAGSNPDYHLWRREQGVYISHR
jgi:hypothetical protein